MDCLDRSQMRATWISTISSVMNTPPKTETLMMDTCLLRNGTLIICIPWIIKGPWIPRGRLFGLFSGVPSKRNTYQKGTLIKKEHLLNRNTYEKELKGILIKRNTHIIKRNTHQKELNTHIKEALKGNTHHGTLLLFFFSHLLL